jgi:hypothetical protein
VVAVMIFLTFSLLIMQMLFWAMAQQASAPS